MIPETLFIVMAVACGYFIALQTKDEVASGRRFFLFATAILSFLVILTFIFGSGSYAPGGLASFELLLVFGLFLGTLAAAQRIPRKQQQYHPRERI